MKLKNKIFTLITAIVGTTIVVSLPFINNNKNTHIINSNQNAWGGGGSAATDETVMQLEFKSKSELETELKDFTPKKPNEFSNEDIKLFLKAKQNSSLGSSWYVQIEKLTDEDIVNGRIKFKVFQNKRKADGSYEKVAIQNNSKDVWDTSEASQLSKYILNSKYKFEWASDEDLKSFFENTNVTAATLDKKTVLDNLVSKDAVLPDATKINVTFSDVGSSSKVSLTDTSLRANEGAKKVTISFDSSVNANQWDGGAPPDSTKLTNTFRGFKVGDSYSDMLMEANNEFVLSSATLDDSENKFFPGLLKNGEKISNLTPSQFVSIVEQDLSNQRTFFNMITKGENIGNKPLVNIMYMGKKTTDSDFNSFTGLTDTFEIKKIRTIPNDLDGSLQLIYTYEAIDIFTNKKVQKEFKQFFPASSFKTSQDSNKILDFSWKADESLLPIGSSYNLVNLYQSNISEKEYLKELTNEFFIGSADSYKQDRQVLIDYNSGGSNNSGSYEPTVSNEKDVKITLTFDSWNGATYTDEKGEIKKGFKAEKVFKLDYFKVGGEGGTTPISIKWKKQNDFISSNGSFVYELPSNIVRRIEKKQNEIDSNVIRKNVFYSLENSQNLEVNEVFIPDDINGIIKIIIEVYQGSGNQRKQLGVFSNIYTGMKKNESASSVIEFSWIPDVGINPELLSIPIVEVTKENVINYYLNGISLFENKSLTENDVELEIIPDSNGVEYLKINVTIPMFDQDKNNVDIESKTFTTKITGFAKLDSKSDVKIVPENDLTALVSIPIAATTTCIFLVILNSMILRRSKIRVFKEKKVKKINNLKKL